MRVGFLSEGATELAFAPGALGDEAWPRAGALVILVERILGVRGSTEPCAPPFPRGAGAGWILKRGAAHLQDVARMGASAAVVLVDADGKGAERLRALRALRERAVARNPRLAIPTAVGVAVEKFDAWLLADEMALCRVLGLPNPSQPMGSPEELRGRGGSADDAKTRLKEYLAEDRHGPRPFLEVVHAIVREMDLDVARQKCPKGFAPFLQEVRHQLGSLFPGAA